MRKSKGAIQSFQKPFRVHKYNQEANTLAVAPQMRPCTKNIAIKYHQFQSFVANGNIKIKYVDIKEQITYIFMKPSDTKLFIFLRYKLNSW